MKISELAKKAGVGTQTVRFYERRGLLPDPGRTGSGYRAYAETHLRQLRFIRQAKALGFSLGEIRDILEMRGRGECPCGRVVALGQRHLQMVDSQIRRLESFRRELDRALRQWKRSGARRVSGEAFCVLIERAMGGSRQRAER
jgi:DNA-binding transcriptional MerR regulator